MKDDVIVNAYMTEDGEYEAKYYAMGFHAKTWEELYLTIENYFNGIDKLMGEKSVSYNANIIIRFLMPRET